MRHRFIFAIALIVGISLIESRWHYGPWEHWGNVDASSESFASGQIEDAYQAHRSGIIVTASGAVERTLADDTSGDKHQRFIMRLSSGITVLVAHNIDIAPRIPDIAPGSPVKIHGEYEWTAKGGTVHWTHKDHRGSHEAGWIEFNGKRYD